MELLRNNVKNIAIVILLIIVAFFILASMKQCEQENISNDESIELANYKDSAMYYKGKLGDQVAYNKSLKLENTKLTEINKELSDAIKNADLKKPKSITKIKTVTEIKEVEVPVYIHDDSELCDYKASFYDSTEHYKISGEIDTSKVSINEISLPDTAYIIRGDKDPGFFKKKIPVITVQHTNPHIVVETIEDYEVKPKKKFFEKFWFQGGVGATIVIIAQISYDRLRNKLSNP